MALDTSASRKSSDGVGRRDEGQSQFRQMAHDLKNHLGVISMGIDALRTACEEADRDEVCEMIRRDGIEPIRSLAAQLVELAGRNPHD
jgi:hypothetical protein